MRDHIEKLQVKKPLTQARLRELLSYDPETGTFIWRTRSNPRGPDLTGRRAGGLDGEGYWHIRIDGKLYGGHRLAWLWVHGRLPNGRLDHINRSQADNRIANLREANPSQNRANSKPEPRQGCFLEEEG
jgi:hypothetical protein